MERKYGRYAIKNLTMYILIGYAIGYVIEMMMPALMNYLVMDPALVCSGQIWRLFTWVITPPQDFSFFVIFMFMFFYWIGTSLERYWGTFRYNVYIFSGLLFMTVGAMVTYLVLHLIDPTVASSVPINISTYYINLASFLAFAMCFPDMQVMLMFIIPIKVKWLAIVDLVLIGYDFISIGTSLRSMESALALQLSTDFTNAAEMASTLINMYIWSSRVMMILPILNFFIFFLLTKKKAFSPKEIHRKTMYKRQVNSATKGKNGISKHKCAICGRTELDGDDLVFRFCSKCNGNYEYCQDHLFTHVHK